MGVDMQALTTFEDELAQAELRVRALRQIVEGLRALGEQQASPAPASQPGSNGNGNGHERQTTLLGAPRGISAVTTIMGDKPGKWTRQRLMREFELRGWFHTTDRRKAEGAVDAAIYRLCNTGRLTKLGAGVYRFPPESGVVMQP